MHTHKRSTKVVGGCVRAQAPLMSDPVHNVSDSLFAPAGATPSTSGPALDASVRPLAPHSLYAHTYMHTYTQTNKQAHTGMAP
jgi:hypothetical protein